MFFNIYSDEIKKINGRPIDNLKFANDKVCITKTENTNTKMLRVLSFTIWDRELGLCKYATDKLKRSQCGL